MSAGPWYPRSAFEPARAPPVARERDEEPERFTPPDSPGRAYCHRHVRRTYSVRRRLRAEPWIPRRPRLMLRRGSRPLPRCSVTSTDFPVREIFHRRELLPRRPSPFGSSRRLGWALAHRGAGALPEMATSCASDRRVTGRFRFAPPVIPHVRGVRSRSPFTCRWKPELPVHASLDPTVTGFRAALLPGAGCPSTSATSFQRRVAFSGRDPCPPRRSVRCCSIGSTVLPSTSRTPCEGGRRPNEAADDAVSPTQPAS